MSTACPSCRAEGSGEGEERRCEKRGNHVPTSHEWTQRRLKGEAKLNHGLIQDDSMVGGLNDEDALSARPQFEKRKRGHVNTVVTSISDSDDSGNESTPVCGTNTKKARGPTQMNKAVYKVPAERKPIAKMGKLKAAIVPKASSRINTVKSEVVEPPSALVNQIKSARQFTDLPIPFRNSALVKQFRATCYHTWMASDDHFDGCSLESDHLLKIVREAFQKTFPDVQYKPVRKDVFHHTIRIKLLS